MFAALHGVLDHIAEIQQILHERLGAVSSLSELSRVDYLERSFCLVNGEWSQRLYIALKRFNMECLDNYGPSLEEHFIYIALVPGGKEVSIHVN